MHQKIPSITKTAPGIRGDGLHPRAATVQFTHSADCPSDVRFTPKSGHEAVRSDCPLCANSGHHAKCVWLDYLLASMLAAGNDSPCASPC